MVVICCCCSVCCGFVLVHFCPTAFCISPSLKMYPGIPHSSTQHAVPALQSLCGGPGAEAVLNDAASLGEVSGWCLGALRSRLCASCGKTAAVWRRLFQHAGKLHRVTHLVLFFSVSFLSHLSPFRITPTPSASPPLSAPAPGKAHKGKIWHVYRENFQEVLI